MNTTPRAAAQLRAIDPGDAARILDRLHELAIPDRATIVELPTPTGAYRAFIARHRDGCSILLGLVPTREEVSP